MILSVGERFPIVVPCQYNTKGEGEDHPNLAAIRWAKENGVVSGYEDGTFGPEAPITREQIAALLWNQQGGSQREQGPGKGLLGGKVFLSQPVHQLVLLAEGHGGCVPRPGPGLP